MDRLVLELKLTPLEAFWHLQRVLERVNAISSSLITSEVFRLDKEETYGDELEKVSQRQGVLRNQTHRKRGHSLCVECSQYYAHHLSSSSDLITIAALYHPTGVVVLSGAW